MKISDLLHLSAIDLKAKAKDKNDAIELAVKTICKTGAIVNVDKYKNGVFKREGESTTGVGDGIAIPHCKSDAVKEPALAALVFKDGVDYESLDGEKVNLLFLIAAPNTSNNVHLDVLAKLSNILMHDEYVLALKKASSPETFLRILDYAEATLDATKAKDAAIADKFPKVLAATACPTGIAHTYMAQEALEKAAKEKGISIKVETNGSGGVKNLITDEEIEHAEGIIVAADAFVEMDRFIGKRVIQVPVSSAIKDAGSLIDMALDPITSIYKPGERRTKQDKKMEGSKFHIFYKHLMSGISHMIPFVVAGGILLAIAYLIDACAGSPKEGINVFNELGEKVAHYDFGSVNIGARIFHMLGADLGLGLMLPVLGGFIAYSIAGRPALVGGFVGGFAASKGSFSLAYFIEIGIHPAGTDMSKMISSSAAGFLGAIVAGFLAGYVVLFLKNKLARLPKTLDGLKDMLMIPLFSTFIVGASMLCVNVPLGYLNIGITKGLMALNDAGAVLFLAALVAALMATDMGGPINKAAHYATLAILTAAMAEGADPKLLPVAEKLMCANIVGIMTPPIGIAIAIWLFPQKFAKGDRTPAIANCVTGVCGITEGAIPYLTKDPVRVLISTVTGAAAGGMLSFGLGGQAIAPEGGTISMMVMGSICWAGLVATVFGSFVTGILLGLLKKDVEPEVAELGKWKGIPTQPVYNFFGKIGTGIGKIFKKGNKSKDKNKVKKEGK